MKKTTRKKLIDYAVLLIITALALYFILSSTDLNELGSIVSMVNPGWIVAGFAGMFLFVLSEGMAVRSVLKPLGEKITVRQGFSYAAVDLYFSAVTPGASGGQPMMVYYMNRDGVSVSGAGIAVLMNTASNILSLVILALLGTVLFPSAVAVGVPLFYALFILGVVIGSSLVAVCLFCIFSKSLVHRFSRLILRLLCFLRIVKNRDAALEKIEHHITEYRSLAKVLKAHPGGAAMALMYNVIHRFGSFFVSYAVYRALGFSAESPAKLIAIQAIAGLTVYSIPLPGAVGISEWAFMVLFSSVYPDRSFLSAAMLLSRGISYYANTLFCAGVTVYKHISVSRKKKQT